MKKRFIAGFVCGALLFGITGVFAGQYIATENTYPIKLNGNDVALEGYQINDYTYFKLRDIGDKVGFNVDFQNDTIMINTKEANKVASTTPSPTNQPVSSLVYETINGVEYISAKNAMKYFEEASFSPVWALGTTAYDANPSPWCYLGHYGIDEWGFLGRLIEEYEIESIVINNVQYISREVFERDVLARVNGK